MSVSIRKHHTHGSIVCDVDLLNNNHNDNAPTSDVSRSWFSNKIHDCSDDLTRLHLIGSCLAMRHTQQLQDDFLETKKTLHCTNVDVSTSIFDANSNVYGISSTSDIKMSANRIFSLVDRNTLHTLTSNLAKESVRKAIIREGLYGIILIQLSFNLDRYIDNLLICSICSNLVERCLYNHLSVFYEYVQNRLSHTVNCDSIWSRPSVNELLEKFSLIRWRITDPYYVLKRLCSKPALNKNITIKSIEKLYDYIYTYYTQNEFSTALFDAVFIHLSIVYDIYGADVVPLLSSIGARLNASYNNPYYHNSRHHRTRYKFEWIFRRNAFQVFKSAFEKCSLGDKFLISIQNIINICLHSNANYTGSQFLIYWFSKYEHRENYIDLFWQTFDHRHILMILVHNDGDRETIQDRQTIGTILIGCLQRCDPDTFLKIFGAACMSHTCIDDFLDRIEVRKSLFMRYGNDYKRNQLFIDAILKASDEHYILSLFRRFCKLANDDDRIPFFKSACITDDHIRYIFRHGLLDVVLYWKQEHLTHPLERLFTSDNLSRLLKYRPFTNIGKWLPYWSHNHDRLRILAQSSYSSRTSPIQRGILAISFVCILDDVIKNVSGNSIFSLLSKKKSRRYNTKSERKVEEHIELLKEIRDILKDIQELCVEYRSSPYSTRDQDQKETQVRMLIYTRIGKLHRPLQDMLLEVVVDNLIRIPFLSHSQISKYMLHEILRIMYDRMRQAFIDKFDSVETFGILCLSALPIMDMDVVRFLIARNPELCIVMHRSVTYYIKLKVQKHEQLRIIDMFKESNRKIKSRNALLIKSFF